MNHDDLHIVPGQPADQSGSPADRVLMLLHKIEWALRDSSVVIAGVSLTNVKFQVDAFDLERRVPLSVAPMRLDTPSDRIERTILAACQLPDIEPSGEMPWLPTSLDPDPRWRDYWANVLVDMAKYSWALREEPFDLRLRSLCLLVPNAAEVTIARAQTTDERWVALLALPGDNIGVAFDIREWIADGRGVSVSPGLRVLAMAESDSVARSLYERWSK